MSTRLFIAVTVIALACLGCSNDATETPIDSSPVSSSSSPVVAPPTLAVEPPATPAPMPVPLPQPVIFQCGDSSLYQSGTALYSDGTTGYEAECDTYVAPAPPPEFRYCDYGGTAVFTDGSYAVNDPRCTATVPSPESGYPYNESEDRNGDGVVNGYERCGVLCGEEPTSGDIQTQYGCEQGYITGPQCE
jgi:hypothetical protein